jgi:predicted metal-dependent peptidase
MTLSEKDKTNLMRLYENVNRFAGIDPAKAAIIKDAERKMDQAYNLVDQVDPFYYSTLTKMLPDNRNIMAQFGIQTMQTDGKLLYYNPVFVNKLPVDAVFTIVVHEIMHVAFGHHILFADIDPKNQNLWHIVNIACDLSINDLLKNRSGFISGGLILAGQGTYKDLPSGLDARQYYDLLVKKYSGEDKNQEPPQEPQDGEDEEDSGDQEGEQDGGDQGGDEGEDGEGDSEGQEGGEEGQEDGDGSGEGEGEGEPSDGSGSGSGKGKGKGKGSSGGAGGGEGDEEGVESTDINVPSFKDFVKQADANNKADIEKGKAAKGAPAEKHQDQIEKELDIPTKDIIDYQKTGAFKPDPNVTEKNQRNAMAEHEKQVEEERHDAEMKEASAAKHGVSYGDARSKLGVGDWKESLEKTTQLNWREILREFINTPSPERPTYNRPPPRFVDEYGKQGLIPRGMTGQTIKELDFLVDVSGSMPDAVVAKVFGEIADIGTELKGKCNVRLSTFNTRIQSERMFTNSGESFESIQALESGMRAMLPRDEEHMMRFDEMPISFANFKFVKTGGGTDVTSALTATKHLKPRPALVIVFTDGDFMENEYASLRSFTDDGMKIVFLLTTEDTSHIKNNAYFDPVKYSIFANVGTVYNLLDYSAYT